MRAAFGSRNAASQPLALMLALQTSLLSTWAEHGERRVLRRRRNRGADAVRSSRGDREKKTSQFGDARDGARFESDARSFQLEEVVLAHSERVLRVNRRLHLESFTNVGEF